MKKFLPILMAAVLMVSVFTGCAGTTVVINECDCEQEHSDGVTETPAPAPELPDGALKTGVAVFADISGSTSATAEEEGAAEYEVTVAAVLVDDSGVIHSAKLDVVPASVNFNAAGEITSDPAAEILTKNEQGDSYGMVAYGGAVAEWYEQADALCQFAVGKTAEELRGGAIDETGKAPAGSDLASSATIYLGGLVEAIVAAAENAEHLGAQTGDELALATVNSISKCTPADAENQGAVQLSLIIGAVTDRSGVISSCKIDAVQADVAFDAQGVVTSDLSAEILTKNQLGEDYGMVAWGGAIAEWDKQAASFAAYVTGKTADEVAGIAVNEATKPADGSDLASSVTISVGDFQTIVAKVYNR